MLLRKESLSFKIEDGLKLQVLESKREVGLIVVITGYGKGKTTTALGIVLRAAGHGLRVCMIEFMKGDLYAGEIDGVKKLAPNVELHLMGKGFCGIQGNPYPYREHRANAHQDALKLAKEKIASGNYDVIISTRSTTHSNCIWWTCRRSSNCLTRNRHFSTLSLLAGTPIPM